MSGGIKDFRRNSSVSVSVPSSKLGAKSSTQKKTLSRTDAHAHRKKHTEPKRQHLVGGGMAERRSISPFTADLHKSGSDQTKSGLPTSHNPTQGGLISNSIRSGSPSTLSNTPYQTPFPISSAPNIKRERSSEQQSPEPRIRNTIRQDVRDKHFPKVFSTTNSPADTEDMIQQARPHFEELAKKRFQENNVPGVTVFYGNKSTRNKVLESLIGTDFSKNNVRDVVSHTLPTNLYNVDKTRSIALHQERGKKGNVTGKDIQVERRPASMELGMGSYTKDGISRTIPHVPTIGDPLKRKPLKK